MPRRTCPECGHKAFTSSVDPIECPDCGTMLWNVDPRPWPSYEEQARDKLLAYTSQRREADARRAEQKAARARSERTTVLSTDALALRCQELDATGLTRAQIAKAIDRSESRVYQLLRRAKNLQSGARYQVPS